MYRVIARKEMKKDKKETFACILSIAIAIVVFSNIIYFFNVKNEYENLYNRYFYGDYSVEITNVDNEVAKNLINSVEVETYGILKLKDLSRFTLVEMDNNFKNMLEGKFHISEGDVPSEDNDIIGEYLTLHKIGGGVGDSVNIEGENYKITGAMRYLPIPFLNIENSIITCNNEGIDLSDDGIYSVYLKLKDKKNQREDIAKILERNNIERERYLLNAEYVDSFEIRLELEEKIIKYFLMGIVTLMTITIICNSFSVSNSKKVKEFGILKSIGATSKQIRMIVYTQSLVIGVMGILLGFILTLLSVKIFTSMITSFISSCVMGEVELKIFTLLKTFVSGSVIALITTFIASFKPAFIAGRIEINQALAGININRKENLINKSPRVIKRIFGDIGVLSYKNIKRSKGTLKFNIFSLSISIILTMVFSTYVFSTMEYDKSNIFNLPDDIEISGNYSEEDKEYIKSLDGVNVYEEKSTQTELSIKDEELTDYYFQCKPKAEHAYETQYYSEIVRLEFYDDNKLNKIESNLIEGTNNKELLENNGVILYDNGINPNFTNLKVGDKVRLPRLGYCGAVIIDKDYRNDYKNVVLNEEFYEFTIVGIIDKIMGVREEEGMDLGIDIIMPLDAVNLLNPIKVECTLTISGTSRNQDKEIFENVGKRIVEAEGSYNSGYDKKDFFHKRQNTINTLGYSFIFMITLMALSSIINTSISNMISRKREVAILKSVGMTSYDIKRMILNENLIIGFWTILFGETFGLIFSKVITYFLGILFRKPVNVSILKLMFIPFIFVFLMILINYINGKKWSYIDIKETLYEN